MYFHFQYHIWEKRMESGNKNVLGGRIIDQSIKDDPKNVEIFVVVCVSFFVKFCLRFTSYKYTLIKIKSAYKYKQQRNELWVSIDRQHPFIFSWLRTTEVKFSQKLSNFKQQRQGGSGYVFGWFSMAFLMVESWENKENKQLI